MVCLNRKLRYAIPTVLARCIYCQLRDYGPSGVFYRRRSSRRPITLVELSCTYPFPLGVDALLMVVGVEVLRSAYAFHQESPSVFTLRAAGKAKPMALLALSHGIHAGVSPKAPRTLPGKMTSVSSLELSCSSS